MNNIERDRMYERYPNHLQALFPMNYFGYQMETGKLVPQYRKNLFHVVAFLDVNNPLSGAVCVAMKEVLNTGEAVRLGLVVYSKDDVITSSAAGSAGKLTPPVSNPSIKVCERSQAQGPGTPCWQRAMLNFRTTW